MSATGQQLLGEFAFLRRRAVQVRILAMALIVATAAAAYAMLSPKWYRSVATVVPVKTQRGGAGLASLLGGDMAGLAAGLADGLGGADTPRIAAVLQSVVVTDAAIEKLDLRARYHAQFQETARDALWSHCAAQVLPKPGLVQLSCEDTDPKFAKRLVEFLTSYGNEVFARINVGSASEQARALEKRVNDLRARADHAAEEMRDFQEKYRIVDLDTQARAVVGAIASLNSQRSTKQLELEYARTFSSGDEATARQLQSQLAVVDRSLRLLEDGAGRTGSEPASEHQGVRGGLFPAAAAVPRVRAEYEKLVRERRVSEATLVFALERLEGAKADEARDTSTFLVLDPPTEPSRPTRPRRALLVLMGLVVGALGTSAHAWLRDGGLGRVLGTRSAEQRTGTP